MVYCVDVDCDTLFKPDGDELRCPDHRDGEPPAAAAAGGDSATGTPRATASQQGFNGMPRVGRHGSGPAPLHAAIEARLATVDTMHHLGPDVRDVLKVELQRLVDEMNADPALAAGWTDPQLRVFTNADELAGVVVDLVKAVAPRSLAGEWLWDWRGLLEDLHDVAAGLVETQEKTAQERACEWVEHRRQVFLSPQLPLGGDDMIGLLAGLIRRSRPGTVQPCAVCGISGLAAARPRRVRRRLRCRQGQGPRRAARRVLARPRPRVRV